jgi:hypothetical protein
MHHGGDPRLAELLAALSLVTDLARGRPPEEALRACLPATRMAGDLGVGSDDSAHVYYMTLLRFAGCSAPSHEYTDALVLRVFGAFAMILALVYAISFPLRQLESTLRGRAATADQVAAPRAARLHPGTDLGHLCPARAPTCRR